MFAEASLVLNSKLLGGKGMVEMLDPGGYFIGRGEV